MMEDFSEKEALFQAMLKGKKIPILTLDVKWHQLFIKSEKSELIQETEKELNDLLKRQGKINTETKQINALKKKLMNEIIELSAQIDAEHVLDTSPLEKDMQTHKRLVTECNEKLEQYEDESKDIPRMIDELNRTLMYETMKECYGWLRENTEYIEEIGAWITDIRKQLKENIIRKQEKELKNQLMYSYMHDIFGASVMEAFDMSYDPLEQLVTNGEATDSKLKAEILKTSSMKRNEEEQ